ncbi:hypothetical protein HZS_348 [Henneguya salminicola]|nr:hypothetical protein HZS_348 [Henneguya salminicola]
MNVFRFIADGSHLIAIILLLLKIWGSRSCNGISGKSQILYLIVFSCRYLDLIYTFVSLYNSIMKITFLVSTTLTIYLIYVKFKATYNRHSDNFNILYAIIPSAALALLFPHKYTVIEILWAFSLYLESISILPQLFLISKTREAEAITSHYLFALGSYRLFYILNWIYKYFINKSFDPISIVTGCIQTALYADFFYLYLTKVIRGKKLTLPA